MTSTLARRCQGARRLAQDSRTDAQTRTARTWTIERSGDGLEAGVGSRSRARRPVQSGPVVAGVSYQRNSCSWSPSRSMSPLVQRPGLLADEHHDARSGGDRQEQPRKLSAGPDGGGEGGCGVPLVGRLRRRFARRRATLGRAPACAAECGAEGGDARPAIRRPAAARAPLARAYSRECATSHTRTVGCRSGRARPASLRAAVCASIPARSPPGWQRLQNAYASPFPPRAAAGAPQPRQTPW